MEIQAKTSDRNLLLELSGDIDHHGARNALRELELAIDAALPKKLVLDMKNVTFMDSCADPPGAAADGSAGWGIPGLQRAAAGQASPAGRQR